MRIQYHPGANSIQNPLLPQADIRDHNVKKFFSLLSRIYKKKPSSSDGMQLP